MSPKSKQARNLTAFVASVFFISAVVGVSFAFASLTFTGTNITGDSGTIIDATGTITIGASSATGITVGRSGITATFPGTVTITGSTTTLQNLVVSGTCVGCGVGNFTAGGDLSGSSTFQTVIGIQGRAVSSTAPSANQVLTWDGSFWTPANAGSGITAINGLSNSTTSIVGAGTVTVSTSSPNVITITGTGSGAITINSLTTSTFQIQGTPNQITVASSAPNIIALSLPQNIGTTNVPTFGGLILNGNATTTNITISGISGSTQCLHVNANGVVSGTGSDCGSGGSSIPGALNDLLYSLGNGTAGVDTGKATYSSTTEIMTVPMLLVQKPVNGTGGSNNLSGITLKPLDGTGKSLASWDNVHTDGPDLYIGGGFLYTRNAIIISGTYHGTGGGYAIDPPTLDPSMLSIQSDVGGPSIQVAASSASGSYNASFLDPNHNYVLNIEANGSLTWSSSTRAAIDTGLGRCGVSTLCLGNGTAGNYSGILKANGVTQASGDTSTLLATDAFVLANVGGGGPPSGAAGGDLSGTYPNPVVVGVNGLTIPASQAFVGTNASSEIVAATAGALPSGTTATTQTAGDNSNKVATDAFVLANGSGNSLAATVHVQTNDWICAHAGDTSIAGQHCTNTVDAVTGIASSNAQVEFATVASVAANYFSSSDTLHAAPQRVRITAEFRNWSTATTPQHDLRVNNTANQEFYDSGFSPAAVSQSGSIWSATWNITATAAADGHVTIGSEFVGMPVAYGYAPPQTGGMFNVAAGTSAYSIFIFDLWGSATGVASGSYTSGGSITGSAGQTCTVSGFNNGNTGGAATVTLTGTNTIAGGTSLSITNTGYGSTGAATTATLGNGTATCSGTATIATVLGGAQGNADQLIGLTFQPLN